MAEIKKKTLLFCIESLRDGGAEKVLLDILAGLDLCKYNVSLFIIKDEGVYFDKIPHGIIWFTAQNAKQYIRVEYDIEIAFLEGLATKYIACRKNNAKKIAWVHTDLYNNNWWRLPFKDEREQWLCYQQMHKIIFVSNFCLKQFDKVFTNIISDKIVIYNPINKSKILTLSNEYTFPKAKQTICSVGSLNPIKGYTLMFPVIKKLIKEGFDFQYLIVGEGSYRDYLEKMIVELNLEMHIFLLGFKHNPYPIIKNSDIFISCSFIEGFSLTICEALCLGKSILSTRSGGPEEILENDRYGISVDIDELNIYKELKSLLLDESKREYYETKAIERANLFNEQKCSMQLCQLWE